MTVTRTGAPASGAPSAPPSLLGPWLATGIGLVGLVVTPDVGVTEPAYAARPSELTGVANSQALSPFIEAAAAAPRLATAAEPTTVSSTGAVFQALVEAPASDSITSADHLFMYVSDPIKPLPRSADALTLGTSSTLTIEQRWGQLRWCEASGSYAAENRSGKYRGAYQFDQATWESVGGVGDPAAASSIEQDKRARILFETRGSSPWPECGRHLD